MKNPSFFNIEYGDEELRNLGKIYKAKIPNIFDIIDKNNIPMLNQTDISQIINDSSKEEEMVPLVIINPVSIKKEDETNLTVNLIIDKLAVGFVFN